MSETMHPAAPHHLPAFITAPGETDVLLTGSAVFLVVMVLVLGSMYFWLHSIPERMAHGTHKVQFQLVAVLALLALFTHNNAFWVAALLLALVPIPDFWTPLATMAESLTRMAGRRLSGVASSEPAMAPPAAIAIVAPPVPLDPAARRQPEATGTTHPAEELGTVPHAAYETAAVPHAGEGSAPSAKAGSKQRRMPPTEGA